MGSVRVAIVGVGNCATSLIQGVEYYKDADPDGTVPGLMHVQFGDYHVTDVEFVAAFDVDAKKVGFDLSEATQRVREQHHQDLRRPADRRRPCSAATPSTASASTTARPSRSPTPSRSTSSRCSRRPRPTCWSPTCRWAPRRPTSSTPSARSTRASPSSTRCPVFIASDPEWAKKFEDAGVPIIGDDIKSQVGATITHRVMAKLFEDRGVVLDRTYQLNVGGNMDFKNMLERDRLESKKISKTQAVTSNIDHDLGARNVHIGPSDYVQWLDDRKWAYVRLEGRAFGDVPLNLEYKLEVWDSPNSAGIIIDAIRAAKIAKDRGIGGPILVGVVVPHEVPAGADARRRGPRAASRPSSAATWSADPAGRSHGCRETATPPLSSPGERPFSVGSTTARRAVHTTARPPPRVLRGWLP